MSVENFIPMLWKTDLLKSLETAHIFAQVANRNYEGKLSGIGDSVKIKSIGSISVSDYAGTVNYEDIDDSALTLTADQDKYWGFKVGDVDDYQADVALRSEAMEEASFSVADKVDAYIEGFRTDSGNDYSKSLTGSGDIITILSQIRKTLVQQNVPRNFPLYLCVTPTFDAYLTEADISNATDNTGTLSRGYVGNYMGFDIYVSNNMTADRAMAGTYRAITFAETFSKTEALRDKDDFKDYVRGRHVYGGKVLRPDELVNVDLS